MEAGARPSRGGKLADADQVATVDACRVPLGGAGRLGRVRGGRQRGGIGMDAAGSLVVAWGMGQRPGDALRRLGDHPAFLRFVAHAEAKPDAGVLAPPRPCAQVERGRGGGSAAARRRAHGGDGTGAREAVALVGRRGHVGGMRRRGGALVRGGDRGRGRQA